MAGSAGILGALVLMIVPTQARDATRAVIKVRGGTEAIAEVKAGQVDAKAVGDRKRLAVLPFRVSGDDPSLAPLRTGSMASVLNDLRYVPNFFVSDRTEVLADLADHPQVKADPKQLAAIASQLGVTALIRGTVVSEGENLGIELEFFEVNGKLAHMIATSKASGPKSQIYSLEDTALLSILAQAKALPSADFVEEMKKIPTQSFEARAQTDTGFAILDQVAGQDRSSAKVKALSEQALGCARTALKADRNHLPAFMLRASCLFNLEKSSELKDCLESARKKNEPSRVDVLTGLELEGDYLTFHDEKFEQAAHQYEKMLQYDPGNLHALWSLTGLYSGDYGAGELARRSDAPAKANRYASLLVLAHPKSAASDVFRPKPSQP